MSEVFIGEIRPFSVDFAPRGWAQCNGQVMQIIQNTALFSLLGTTYGGDGRVTFALPDLRGRVPLHVGPTLVQGQTGGQAAHTLGNNEMPSHGHQALAARAADSPSPGGTAWADGGQASYGGSPTATMAGTALGESGGNQPHENRPPYLTLNFCIALQGIFPSRN